MDLSVVVPAYKAERFIAASLKKLQSFLEAHRELLGEFEIIVVDDGSPDQTAAVVAESHPQVKLLCHDRNRGKGAAVRTGMLAAQGKYRYFVDCDLPYDLEVLIPIHRGLTLQEFQICIGSREVPGAVFHAHRRGLRRVASILFTAFVGRVVVTGVHDTQCGVKGFRGEIAEYLFRSSRVNSFAFDVELLYLAHKNNFEMKRVPVRMVTNEASTIRLCRDATIMLRDILLLPIRYYSGRYPLMSEGNEQGGKADD